MRRGDVWTASGDGGEARPVVVVQDDRFSATPSVTVCAATTDPTDARLFRVAVAPSERNGLGQPVRLMADKLTTVSRDRLDRRLGRLDEPDLARLDAALGLFLGLVPPRG